MSAFYRAVNWNRQKYLYDGALAGGVLLYLAGFVGLSLRDPNATLETALIRGLGTGALVLLTVILAIGPMARLDARFLPLLYNRRHLGVTMCLLALGHAGFSLIQFHSLGDVNPLVSLLTATADPARPGAFPFELLGLAALLILLLMAATSHDFWLATLSAPVWKALHMLVYVAYGLLIGHVALGSLQESPSPWPAALLLGSAAAVFLLHLVAGWRERRGDREAAPPTDWVDVCRVDEIRESRARMAMVGGERIAVFRHEGKLSCVSNVCAHQNGPLGEGKIVDGCITCPWHGYQYRPEDGQSPPPFTEKIPTFHLRVVEGRVQVDPRPNPPGTRVEPVVIGMADRRTVGPSDDPFYVGYHPEAPPVLGRAARNRTLALLCLTLLLAIGLAALQDRADPGTFEYGTTRAYRGQLREFPYPSLLVPADGDDAAAARYTRHLLVAQGKHGAAALARGMDGAWVEVRGTRIARPEREMLELGVHAITETPPAPNVRMGILIEPPYSLGIQRLTGEIVDSKCWLGVMKPNRGTVHRGCATRCLSGGIPPILMTSDSAGGSRHLLLTDAAGQPAPAWFRGLVGEPVTVSGEVIQDGDIAVMRVREVVVVGRR
ncbi:MAG: ferric reductase-like transmembrane domain-containing protein [Gemmatimonadota bacterium]|nr:ferric reductase-like transmembrane domain-containing protein [Gemmatimonadota bacterium]